jgi:hypothetical protein
MSEQMLSAGEAAEILEMSSAGARFALGKHHGREKLPSGHNVMVWRRSYVEELKRDRVFEGKKVRDGKKGKSGGNCCHDPRDYRPPKKKCWEFEVNEHGRMVKPELTYRGRVCRFDGCTVPVPTGRLMCDKHTDEFKAMRKRSENWEE